MEILAENLGVSKSINFLTLDHTIALSDAGAAGLSNADADIIKDFNEGDTIKLGGDEQV